MVGLYENMIGHGSDDELDLITDNLDNSILSINLTLTSSVRDDERRYDSISVSSICANLLQGASLQYLEDRFSFPILKCRPMFPATQATE